MDLVSTLRPRLVIDLDYIMEPISFDLKVFDREHIIRNGGHLSLIKNFRANGVGHATVSWSDSGSGRGCPTRLRWALFNQSIYSHTKVAPGQIVHFSLELSLILHLIHVEILNMTKRCQLHLELFVEIVGHFDHLSRQLSQL